jgi:hypothetical protein
MVCGYGKKYSIAIFGAIFFTANLLATNLLAVT